MSAQPQQPQQLTRPGQDEQRWREMLDQILGGELPGEGYLFSNAPDERNQSEVNTSPEQVRAKLLRAVEVCAKNAALPYGMVTKAELAKAALAFSQAYLLLDPAVDENGVPVGAAAEAQGKAQEGAAAAQGGAQIAAQLQQHELTLAQQDQKHQQALELETHRASLKPDPESFKRAPATGGHAEPPRVQPNAAEKEIETEHEDATHVLKGARGDRPLPKPRVGS